MSTDADTRRAGGKDLGSGAYSKNRLTTFRAILTRGASDSVSPSPAGCYRIKGRFCRRS